MGRRGVAAVVIALIAVAIAVLVVATSPPSLTDLTVTEQSTGREIKPFYDQQDNIYYLFIPAYTDKEHLSVGCPDGVSLHFAAHGHDYGSSLAAVPCDESVEVVVANKVREKGYTLYLHQSKNIATLFVDMSKGGLEAVRQNKEHKAPAVVETIAADGAMVYSGQGTLTGKGNSTWAEAKKPYNLRFKQRVALAGDSDAAATWSLLANYSDDSQLRNALCHYMAQQVGIPYTSNIYIVSLYINGEYQGLYNIATREGYMADISAIAAVFEATREDRVYHGITDNDFCFRTRYGDTDSICKYIDAFETVLYDKSTPYEALSEYADLTLFAAKMFLDVLCGDSDLALSQYYMLTHADIIAPICAWDYDNTFGSTFFYLNFAYNMIDVTNDWYNELFRYEEFRHELLYLITERYGALLPRAIDYLDSTCVEIAAAWQANQLRWRHEPPCWGGRGALLTTDYDLSTLQGQKAYIVDFLTLRWAFLEGYWRAPEQYCRFTFNANGSEYLEAPKVAMFPRGDTLRADMLADGLLTMPEEGFGGWYTADSTALTEVEVISHDMEFYEKYKARPKIVRLFRKALRKAPLLVAVLLAGGCWVLWLIILAVRRRCMRGKKDRKE